MTTPEQHTDRPRRDEQYDEQYDDGRRDERGFGQRLKDAVLGEPAHEESRRRDEVRDDTGRAGTADVGRGGTADPARDTGLLDRERRPDRVEGDRVEGDADPGGWGRQDDTAAGRHAPADVGTADRDRTADRDAGSGRGVVADQGAALDREARTNRDTDADRGAQLDREATSVGGDGGGDRERLIPPQRAQEYSARWDALKGDFVDEPRQAMAKADQLVDDLLDEIQELFRHQRRDLEQGLDRDQASTEDLRLALRRYRSFFDRLLSF